MTHPFSFDPTYGYDEARLLTVPAPEGPADFEAFWRSTFAEAQEVPVQVERHQISSPRADFDLFEIEYTGLGGFRVGGWLSVPNSTPIEHGLVLGHGYGGRDAPEFEPGAVVLAPCARGFNRSARPDLPTDAPHHVIRGIATRETYLIRLCVADLWSAASALLELYPNLRGRLNYAGTSFGGGIGALALPWDDRFAKAFLAVPTFGNHPLRLTLPSIGSGESLRVYHRRHPEVVEVLAFFDAATAARYVTKPTLAVCALFDPAVPPPGQFAVYNALAGPKALMTPPCGHFEYARQAEMDREVELRRHAWWRS